MSEERNGSKPAAGYFVAAELFQVILNVLASLPYNTPAGVSGRVTGDVVNILRALEPIEQENVIESK